MFNARSLKVDQNQFELIKGCRSAKEAWDILQNVFEGTSNVRQFENYLVSLIFFLKQTRWSFNVIDKN